MKAFWEGLSPFLRSMETSMRWPTGTRVGSASALISTRLGQLLGEKGAKRRGRPILTNGGMRRLIAMRIISAAAAPETEYQTGLVTRARERSVFGPARWLR